MTAFTIGTAAHHDKRGTGYVTAFTPKEGPHRHSIMTGAGFVTILADVEFVFGDQLHTMSDVEAVDLIEDARARGLDGIGEDQAKQLRATAVEKREAFREKLRRDREEADRLRAEFVADAENRIPAGAAAVIIAELMEDNSDSMTDYFNSITTRTVILGFSTHTRDLFPEMRKAALNHPETAFLATAPAEAEHREKHSMGGGYYLKDGYRHNSGWKVSKTRIRSASDIPTGEWSTEPPAGEPAASVQSIAGAGYTIEQHDHTKGGFTMSLVVLSDRVDRDRFEFLRDAAKAAGGWYSRAWSKTPAGFAFRDEAAALDFAREHIGDPAPATEAAPAVATSTRPAPARPASALHIAGKLRAMADSLDSPIRDKFADRRTNTPKQQRQAQSARLDGYQLQRAQKAMRALADCAEAGTTPDSLIGITSKKDILELCRAEIDRSGGYYDAGHETGRPARDTQQTRDLWALIGGADQASREAEQLRAKIDGLKFAKIPGYFPTPPEVVADMIQRAALPHGPFVMLETGAGSGAILDAVREAAPAATFLAYERNHTLREILTAKGYELAGDDFTASDTSRKVARVLMNPPFENGQDMEHVQRAFDHLEPGGRLVAIMSPGPFFRNDRKAQAFRDWFNDLCGATISLPEGSFKESGTGVGTRMVILEKGFYGKGDRPPEGEISEPAQDPASDPAPDPCEVAPAPVAREPVEAFMAGEPLRYMAAGRWMVATFRGDTVPPCLSIKAEDGGKFSVAGRERRKYEPIMSATEARSFFLNLQPRNPAAPLDMKDVKAQETAKRALEIAATGGLSIHLRGDAGQGKTMLIEAAKALGDFPATESRGWSGVCADLWVDLCRVSAADQILPYPAETTAMIAERVQAGRLAVEALCPGFYSLPLAKVAAHVEAQLDEQARRLMAQAIEAMQLSPEQSARVYKVSVVIAALDHRCGDRVGRIHIAEALSYRRQQLRKREKTPQERDLIRLAWSYRAKARAGRSERRLALGDRVRLLQASYAGEVASAISAKEVDRYAQANHLLFKTDTGRYVRADPNAEGEQWERLTSAPPPPPPSGLEREEREHLEGEIDRLRAIVDQQAGDLGQARADLDQATERAAAAERAALADRRLADSAFAQLAARAVQRSTIPETPAALLLPVMTSRPRPATA